jgi:hypothetical protein
MWNYITSLSFLFLHLQKTQELFVEGKVWTM